MQSVASVSKLGMVDLKENEMMKINGGLSWVDVAVGIIVGEVWNWTKKQMRKKVTVRDILNDPRSHYPTP